MLTTLYNICTQVCGVVWTLLSCALQFQVSVTIRTCVTSGVLSSWASSGSYFSIHTIR